ncbi:MAG: hypothetical protein AAFU73_20130 [Planctomycetota bacterium]
MNDPVFDGLSAWAIAVHAVRSASRALPILDAAVARGELSVQFVDAVRGALIAADRAADATDAAVAAASAIKISDAAATAARRDAMSAADDARVAADTVEALNPGKIATRYAGSAAIAAARGAAGAAEAAADAAFSITGAAARAAAVAKAARHARGAAISARGAARAAAAAHGINERAAAAADDAAAAADLKALRVKSRPSSLGPLWPNGEPEHLALLRQPTEQYQRDRESELDNDVDPNALVLRAVIDPGSATPEQVGGVLGRISNIYRALGFEGVDFSLEYEHEYVDLEVPQ